MIKNINLFLITNIISFLGINSGIMYVFSNIMLNYFDQNNLTWFTSIAGISCILGCLICSNTVDNYGRKPVIILLGVICSLSWWLMFFSNNSLYILYLSRILCGIASGLIPVTMIYIGEIIPIKYPYSFTLLLFIYSSLGILFTSILKLYFNWEIISLIYALLFTIISIFLIFIPESPYWLYNNNYFKETKIIINFLYSKNDDYIKEKLDYFFNDKKITIEKAIEKKNVKKTFILLLIIFILQALSGIYFFISYTLYTIPIIYSKFSLINENIIFISMSIIRTITSFLSILISKYFSDKMILIWSSIFSGIFSLLLFLMKFFNKLDIIKIILFSCYFISNALGVMTIPFILNNNVWKDNIRGKYSSYIVLIFYLLYFFTAKFYINIFNYSQYIVFLVSGVSCMLLTYISFKYL